VTASGLVALEEQADTTKLKPSPTAKSTDKEWIFRCRKFEYKSCQVHKILVFKNFINIDAYNQVFLE
jgi:hypothetical protein